MNLSALMNDGAVEESDQKKKSPEVYRSSQPPLPTGVSGQPPPLSYGPPSHVQAPIFPPPPTPGSARASQSQSLTPLQLQTPSQVPSGGQHPFPQPYSQPYSAITPGARPPSHGYQYPQLSPFQPHSAGLQQSALAHTTSSISPTPSSHHSQTPHSARQISIDNLIESPSALHRPSPQQYRTSPPYPNQSVRERSMSVSPKTIVMPSPQGMQTLKRAATELTMGQPPTKQRKTTDNGPEIVPAAITAPPKNFIPKEARTTPHESAKPDGPMKNGLPKRRPQRPPWAQLSKHNPRAKHQQNGAPQAQAHPQPNGKMNGNGQEPWQHNPPLDMDLINASNILGKWEKTMNWNTPLPDMLRVVQDWLYVQLNELAHLGTDPREGTIEIEAKVGTLRRLESEERWKAPVMSMAVIPPEANGQFHFESQMTLAEHKTMNDALNKAVQESMTSGRVPMRYTHLYETDSFHTLSPLGHQMLPPSLQRHTKRERRLRITTDSKTGRIKARIVKIPITNLHIYNPQFNYDCRISINYEVNLDRPDIDPDALITDGNRPNNPNDLSIKRPVVQEVPRIKDRLSYKHLAYSIDLTKVEREGLGATYELELEVESALLRQQMELMKRGERENAYGEIVSGFLDNATILMRLKPAMGA